MKGHLQFTLSGNLKKNIKIILELKTFFSEIPLQWMFESSLSIGVFLKSLKVYTYPIWHQIKAARYDLLIIILIPEAKFSLGKSFTFTYLPCPHVVNLSPCFFSMWAIARFHGYCWSNIIIWVVWSFSHCDSWPSGAPLVGKVLKSATLRLSTNKEKIWAVAYISRVRSKYGAGLSYLVAGVILYEVDHVDKQFYPRK